jgi:hypothetical protein
MELVFPGTRREVVELQPQQRVVPRVAKHEDEAFVVRYRYQPDEHLFDGALLTAGEAEAEALSDGTDASGLVLASTSATIDEGGLRASLDVLDGASEEDYLVTLRLSVDSGAVLVEQFILNVRSRPAT